MEATLQFYFVTARLAGMRAEGRPAAQPVLRRDALRNRDAILSAAREVFAADGLEAPLEEIARRAGVGIATLYRRFPTRLELIDAVLVDAISSQVDIAERALSIEDPWQAFVFYLEQTGEVQANDRTMSDMMAIRLPKETAVETTKARLYQMVVRIVARAQESGQLRADVTPEDLALWTWANTSILEATHSFAPDAWRRHLALLIDGMRAVHREEIAAKPVTPRQVYRAMFSLGRRCSGRRD